jgi:hypothetical protein
MKIFNFGKRFGKFIIKWVNDASPTNVFFATVLIGFSLIIYSYLLDIHSVKIAREIKGVQYYREVGYFYAISWSLNCSIFFPFALYFMLKSLQSILHTLKALTTLKMVRNQHNEILNFEKMTDLWQKRAESSASLGIMIAMLVATSLSFGEWYLTNFRPLMIPGYEPIQSSLDWGVGVLVHNHKLLSIANISPWLRILNLIFDLICFAFQGLLIFSIISYFVLMTGFSKLFAKDLEHADVFLIPNIESKDKRQGFEEFEPMMTEMLFAALFTYILAYLSRLQNIYLHCPSATSLWDFVREDIVLGFLSIDKFQLFSWQAACTDALPIELPDILVVSCTLLVILALLMIVMLTLRQTAESAKSRLRRIINEGKDFSQISHRTKEDIETRLMEMEIWPMRFPKFNALLTICVLGIAAIWFYKIGLFILGIILAVLIYRVVFEMRKSKK